MEQSDCLFERDFVAVGYAQHHLCRNSHAEMAMADGFILYAWVDATSIKNNPGPEALLVGNGMRKTAICGGSSLLRTATKSPKGQCLL